MFKKLLLTAATAGVLATAGSSVLATSAEAHPWRHGHWHRWHPHHVFWGCHKVVRWHHHHRIVTRVCY